MLLDKEELAMGEELAERIIKYFSEVLKQEREKQGLTVEQLASAVEEDVEVIKLLESGEVDKLNDVPASVMFYVASKLNIDFGETFISVRNRAMEELN